MRLILTLCISTVCTLFSYSQHASSSEIFNSLVGLKQYGKVLYVAAHPDDENTRFITYCSKIKHFETAYFSFTRGDGGQNLIGQELREELGLIRTQELLEARKIDGGYQFFSRANDFGYSKTAKETLQIWDSTAVLKDLVYVIRYFQPDVVVCRFPTDGRGGHGHHTASALLAVKAFDLAGKSSAFPEQLSELKTWSPIRIVTNTGRWWNDKINASDPNVVAENIGVYNPLLGYSVNEIAALSRSQHKSQGFGSSGSRGKSDEFFEHLAGKRANQSLFEGIEDRKPAEWSNMERELQKTIDRFNWQKPELIVGDLLSIREQAQLNGAFSIRWVECLDKVIEQCAGIYAHVRTDRQFYGRGDSLTLDIEVIAQQLEGIQCSIEFYGIQVPKQAKNQEERLAINEKWSFKTNAFLPDTTPYFQPFWLEEEGTLGMYKIPGNEWVKHPYNPTTIRAEVIFAWNGKKWRKSVPLTYHLTDPVKGEVNQPVFCVPDVSLSVANPLAIVREGESCATQVSVKAYSDAVEGRIIFQAPAGWVVNPSERRIDLPQYGQSLSFSLQITPDERMPSGEIQMLFVPDNGSRTVFSNAIKTINYDHIPTQVYLQPAVIKVKSLNLKNTAEKVGYLPGAGDRLPEAIELMGSQVVTLQNPQQISDKLDAIVVGVRALNTIEQLSDWTSKINEYVKSGGVVIYQYNTSHHLMQENFTPYTLRLSRDRVTNEKAPVKVISSTHRALRYPNVISSADFDFWVQERGLYFPNEWSDEFEPMLEMGDPDEKPSKGALLIASYGKGFIVYTGLSLFRQLPEGVEGAYRLLANLISLKHGAIR